LEMELGRKKEEAVVADGQIDQVLVQAEVAPVPTVEKKYLIKQAFLVLPLFVLNAMQKW